MIKNAGNIFLDIVAGNRVGTTKGIYSICSAHSDVLASCFKQAKEDSTLILIESTSNQVDQYGGYTGMKPIDFVRFVHSIADRAGFPKDLILLGGDHLGPNSWQSLPAHKAMEKASVLIEEYVKAGYRKIHLDASMFCGDDKGDRSKTLDDDIVAKRTTDLCQVAENSWKKYISAVPELIYIIGTEVPVPGGAREIEENVNPTDAEKAETTLTISKKHFLKAGLSAAWDRVTGLVVQPGVEFGDDQIFRYQRNKAKILSEKILEYKNLVYEAHSTDYQSETCLKALVEDHFCILKVGPWLTFAYREALFALEAIETEILGKGNDDLSQLANTLERVMIKEPRYWKSYYKGDETEKYFKRKFSFSDRSRYYWPDPQLEAAKNRLYRNLFSNRIPLSVLSQFMPAQFYEICEGKIQLSPEDLIHSHIRKVAGLYARACGLTKSESGIINKLTFEQ
jgi:D-tagatose-1,6-bisphosphate aldolase subunit GatZ/KbaZ